MRRDNMKTIQVSDKLYKLLVFQMERYDLPNFDEAFKKIMVDTLAKVGIT